MSTQVRWYIQVSNRKYGSWFTRDDLTYSGWFYSGGDEEPTEALLTDFREAVETFTWLDVRLVKETRSSEKTVINMVTRDKS